MTSHGVEKPEHSVISDSSCELFPQKAVTVVLLL